MRDFGASDLGAPAPVRTTGDSAPTIRPPARLQRADIRRAILLALVAWLAYNANLRPIATGDSLPARFLPLAILGEGTLQLDPVLEATVAGHASPYWLLDDRHGGKSSLYPIVTPLLVTPLYLPAYWYLETRGWDPHRLAMVGAVMEKLAASAVAATAAALLFLAVRRRCGPRDSLLLFVAFAFGTNTWATSSQALWQHGTAELLLAALLVLVTGPGHLWRVAAAGVFCGLVIVNRPFDLFLAAAFAVYAPFWSGRRAVLFFLAAAVPIVLVAAYNLSSFGVVTGGYGLLLAAAPELVGKPVSAGVAGLLISPGKGLFVFSPFLLFLPFFALRAIRAPSTRVLTLLLLVAVVAQIVFYATTEWRGGWSYGPRFLTDLLPLAVWMLAPVLSSLGQLLRTLFLIACLLSIGVQVVGAFVYQGLSDPALTASPEAVWEPGNAPFVVEPRGGLAPMTFLQLAGLPPEQTYPGYWLRSWGLR